MKLYFYFTLLFGIVLGASGSTNAQSIIGPPDVYLNATHTYSFTSSYTLYSHTWGIVRGTKVSEIQNGLTYTVTVKWTSTGAGSVKISDTDPFFGKQTLSTLGVTISLLPLPAQPVEMAASSISTNSFVANWSVSSNADGYYLDVATTNDFSSFVSGYNNLTVNGTSQAVTGLTEGTTYYYRVRAVNGSGTSTNSGTTSVLTLPVAPQANAATSIATRSFTANWNNASSATSYQLDVSTSSAFTSFVSGYNNLTVNGISQSVTGLPSGVAYYYRVRAVNASGASANSNTITATLFKDQNYIRTINVMVEGMINEPQVNNAAIGQKLVKMDFFDGLGRISQTVVQQQSPNQLDAVQPFVYDSFGRETDKYLHYVSGSNGWFKEDFISKEDANYTTSSSPQFQFYQNTNKVVTDAKPYSETIFEPSPLNRPIKSFAPGAAWSNKPVELKYLINNHGTGSSNTSEKVIAWKINTSGIPERETASATYIETGGYFSTGQLFVNATIDEQGNAVREYKNKSGQVILKKVQAIANSTNLNSTTDWALTYYIYDDFGNLRFVFPPELSKIIHQNDGTGYNPSSTDINNWAFLYKYDERKRMKVKKVPGADSVYMVYDKRDRLVLTQDGNQRATTPKYWSFTKYDELNRPILTGIKDTTAALTQAQMQAVVDAHYNKAWAKYGESYVGNVTNNIHGYTNNAYPRVTGPTTTISKDRYLSVTYYDKYSFRSLWTGTYTYLNESLSESANGITYTQPTTEFTRVIGQVTGTKIKVLDGGVAGGYTWLKTVSYYDDKYRVIQSLTDNYKGGVDRVTNVYDFVGKVLKTKSTHEEKDVTWKDQIGVSLIGNKLLRTAASNNWTGSGAISAQQLAAGQNGWIEFVVSEVNSNRMIGFADTNPNVNYTSIDYAFYLNTNALKVYENGASKFTVSGTLVPGDVLRIERTGTTVKYSKNGVVVYTSATASNSLLFVDASLYTTGGTLTGVITSFSSTLRSTTRRFEYDHVGRLLNTWHQLDAQPEILLTKNKYNELGQLVDKKLHSTVASASNAKQSVDYRYNIRGWLTSINNSQLANEPMTNDDTNDFFGMNLLYEQEDTNLDNDQLYNGNISAMKWSAGFGTASVKEKAYTYNYDALNRISGSAFKEKTSSWSVPTNNAFAETGYSYDLNGNIKTLQRYDKRASGLMDNLTYDYGTTASNKLLKVTDAGDDYLGFVDGTNTGDDYTYDANGNMITDQNKGITSAITYNYLNLPEVISRGTSNTIRYIYDAGGRKLAQVTTFNSSQKQTDYVGEYQYENDALQHLSHEEGRIVLTSTETVFTHSADVTDNITAVNATLTAVTQNGDQKYVRANSSGTTARTGMFPIGGTFAVQPGETYRIRAKGYRTSTNAVYLNVKVNGLDINWPGATLASSASTEAWTEQIVTIPAGGTSLQAGVIWNTVALNNQFFLNEFEIVKLATNAAPEYQYTLKDHLGNARLTFTTKREVEAPVATMETANASAELSKFIYYDEAVKINYPMYDHTNSGATTYATRLTGGSTNEKYGLAKSLSVMPGDTLNIEVYAKYLDSNSSNWTAALNNFITSIANGTAPAGTLVDGGASGSIGSQTFPYIGTLTRADDNGTGPKAYVNYLLFDRNFVYQTGGFKRISSTPRETGTDVAHERLAFDNLVITEPGYIYIYLSNENETNVEVYFDDFKVEHIKSPVIQTDDYYPFGGRFNSYSRENTVPNKYLYNKGSELQDDLGLDVYQTHFRMLDVWIGRWWQVDPKASATYDMSVYSSMNNNPIRYNDPLGDIVEIEHRRGFLGLGKKETLTYNNGSLTKADGSAYTGKVKGFLGKTVNALNGVAAGSATGSRLLGEAQSSANTFKIVKTSGDNKFVASNTRAANANAINATTPGLAPAGGSGGTVHWNPKGGNVMETGGNYTKSPDTNLAHELLGHGIDANRGEADNTVVNGLKRDEWQATFVENTIRGEMGRPLREYYRVQDSGGVMSGLPPLMVTGGVPVQPPTMANGATYIRP